MAYLRGPDWFNPYAWVVSLLRLRSTPRSPVLPSVGVGNLRTGGTGKTPLVLELVKRLPDPAVVTLGYRRRYRRGCFTSEEHPSPDYLGDEGFMLYKKGGVPVIACKDRFKGAEMARTLGARTVVYDDVFQYFGIRPHVSILLLRPSDVGAYTLPFGPLREPFGAYRFADLLTFNFKLDPPSPLPDLGKPTFTMRYRVEGMVKDGEVLPLKGQRVFVFCAIADPMSFIRAVREGGAVIVGKRIYPDHWWIPKGEVESIVRKAEALNAVPLCTEKDYYRLGYPSLPYLKVSLDVDEGLFSEVLRRLKPFL